MGTIMRFSFFSPIVIVQYNIIYQSVDIDRGYIRIIYIYDNICDYFAFIYRDDCLRFCRWSTTACDPRMGNRRKKDIRL